MAANIQSYVVTATKTAGSNNDVRIDVFTSNDGVNSTGELRFSFLMKAADVTSMNTTVNGGAVGATLSFAYPQNYNAAQYSVGQVWVT